MTLSNMGIWTLEEGIERKVMGVYRGDRYYCPGCGIIIITDFGLNLFHAEQYKSQEARDELVASIKAGVYQTMKAV